MLKRLNQPIVILLMINLVAGAALMWWVANHTDKAMRDELLVQARLVSRAIDMKKILSLSGSEIDLNTPQYLRIKNKLASMRGVNPRCKFLYLIKQRTDGRVIFLVDSLEKDSHDYAPPGLVYEEVPNSILTAFSSEEAVVTGPVTDRWGTLVTAAVPIMDGQTGALVAILGMDILADDWNKEILLRSSVPFVVMLLFGALLLFTERKRTENELRESRNRLRENEERLDMAMSVKNEGMWDWDLKTDTMYYDQRYFKMSGYQVDEFPHNLEEFEKRVHPDDIEYVREQIQQYLENKTGEYAVEFRFKRKDGDWMWILGRAKIVERDKNGKPTRFMGTHSDITERKLAENEIKNFKKAMDASSDAIGMATADGEHYYQNSRFDELFGDVGTDPPSTLYVDEKMGREVFNTILSGNEWIGEVAMYGRDKSVLDILLRAYPVKKDGRVTAVVGMHTNITELKKAEEELKKMDRLKSVGTLAGGIAHDFNNILSGVFGNISIARIHLDRTHPSYNFLEEAEKSMERATLLTRQLLTFSRGGDPIKEDVSIERLVREVVRFDLSGSNVKPVFQVDDDLWMAKVDTGQMQQVFSNLTINADQAMPEGGHLYVVLENVEIEDPALTLAPGKYVRATIRDEGSGIDREHLDKIFDPYFTTRQTGSGLGLATVYSIINKHGGHISVSSTPGSGSTFTLYLPVHQSITRIEKQHPDNIKSAIDYPARILVMDDEQMIREIALKMLQVAGCQVETATDGKEAIEKYKKSMHSDNPFDLVIMDMTVPGGMGGEEAIKELLALDPNAKAIVSSGYSHGSLQSSYAEYGFVGMISKPYNMEALLEVVQRVLTG